MMLPIPPAFANPLYVPPTFSETLLDVVSELTGPNALLYISIAVLNALFDGMLLFLLARRDARMLLTVIVTNLVTWPLMFYVISVWPELRSVPILVELAVVVVETAVVYLMHRPMSLPALAWKVALANAITAVAGTLWVIPLIRDILG